MENSEIIELYNKIEMEFKWGRWISLLLSLVIIFLAFKPEIVPIIASSKLPVIFPGIGGALLGVTLSNWNGSKKLKLLRVLIKNNENT